MRPGAGIILVSAARLYTPLMALFALTLLAGYAPGKGVGFTAGLAFALIFVLHALVFGADALRSAFPPTSLRLVLAAGVIATMVGAGAPGLRFALMPIPQKRTRSPSRADKVCCALRPSELPRRFRCVRVPK